MKMTAERSGIPVRERQTKNKDVDKINEATTVIVQAKDNKMANIVSQCRRLLDLEFFLILAIIGSALAIVFI